MKKIIITGAMIILGLGIGLLVIYIFRFKEDHDYRKRGNLLIDKIEVFSRYEKRLPNTVNELGLRQPMNQGPYYELLDSANYVIYFNIGFDDSYVYCSNTKKWSYSQSIFDCKPK